MSGNWQFWIDRGGTFTDVVGQRPDGSLITHKLLSENPERYKDAAVQGIKDLMGTDNPPAGSIRAVKMGTTVATKYGPMKTDHVLFIASGAFHVSKPSDMLPELQGRLPIRVELRALTEEDFVRILSETRANLVEQYRALLGTEKVTLDFTEDAISEVAKIAAQVNESVENIGARRLQTVMERLLEEISFEAEDHADETIKIDAAYVRDRLADLAGDSDLSKYIL